MVTFILSIAEVVRMKRVDFSKCWKARCSALSRGFWRETTPDTLVPPMAGLNRLLSDKLPTDQIFIYSAMGDDGRPPAAHFSYLQVGSILRRVAAHL